MTSLTYRTIEIDVPHCSLTYGVSPCRAQLGFAAGGEPNAVGIFNDGGSNTYARRVGGLTGAADSTQVTGSFWFWTDETTTDATLFAGETALAGTTTRFRIRLINSQIRITGASSAGTTILDIRTTANLPEEAWVHILFSVDLTDTAKRHLYVDGVSDLNVTTYTNASIDFTLADWSFLALADGSGAFLGFDLGVSAYADFWLQTGLYIDFSNASNRALFIDSDGRPVSLGSTGQTPTGSSPRVFFGNSDESFYTNLGTGGGFTVQNSGDQFEAEFASGSIKCFNSLGTCQDINNYDNAPITLIFGEDVSYKNTRELADLRIYPLIKSIDFQPSIVSLGENMGQRASIKIVFKDARDSDAGPDFDKYPESRTYTPYDQGTFWGKFRARNPYLQFAPLRYVVQDANSGNIEIRHFLIDSISGPSVSGEFIIVARDVLKMADSELAKAPPQTTGYLSSGIGTSDPQSITVAPDDTLDAEYPDDGFLCIGGSEIAIFTQTGTNTANLTPRGIGGTDNQDHDANERLQLVEAFDAESPAFVLETLLLGRAGADEAWIDFDAWDAEDVAAGSIALTALLTEPTGVASLISEVLEIIGAALWWDDVNQQLRFQYLRDIPTDADVFNEDNVIAGSLEITEQPEKRYSRVTVYFNPRDYTQAKDKVDNYKSYWTETHEESEALQGMSLKTIFARWIPEGGQLHAQRIAQNYLSRYLVPPRRFKFEVMRFAGNPPVLGGGYRLGGGEVKNESWPFQDETGARVDVPIQITRVSPLPDRFQVEAEEIHFTPFGADFDPDNHVIIFDTDQYEINLRESHDSLYSDIDSGQTVTCYIYPGVIIGSDSVNNYAFSTGTFPAGVTVNVHLQGRIEGKGGNGGGQGGLNGQNGGPAMLVEQAINLFLDEGDAQIWGGSGGGGGGQSGTIFVGGGGGSGRNAGAGGVGAGGQPGRADGSSGTEDTGGSGGEIQGINQNLHGGAGGNATSNGSSATQVNLPGASLGSGGSSGVAIQGVSNATKTGTGDIRGTQQG